MAAPAPLEEPFVGKVLTERTFTVDDTVVNSHWRGLSLDPHASGLLPSTLLSLPDNDYIHEAGYTNRFGHLWVRQGWAFFRPLEAGATYRVTGEIRDIYSRRDRNVVLYETKISDAQGNLAAASEHHQSFLKEAPSSEEVALRDPSKKPGAREFVVPAGDRFDGPERVISAEMCGEFFHGKANYHTDRDASKALGFKDIVVGGRMTMAYVAHMLETKFGATWQTSGRLDIKFTNPVWVDDTVTAHGVLTGPSANDPARTDAFVWVTRTDGTVVLVGNASVPNN